ncbi:DUF202 domain-containing protein [Saccharopolyspora cebuensis]|uniref:YidH family protein n=1 Tax=Saccharopolyspora cebuensis TaxID=418759 RepID=A0ABV4CHR4_9PSEU
MLGPWDPGLQVERTTLAWLRTALAFTVGMLVFLRFIVHVSALAAALCAAATLPLAVGVAGFAWRRHLRVDRSVRADQPLPDGRLPAALTALACLVALCGLVYVALS